MAEEMSSDNGHSKVAIRKKIWNDLYDRDELMFPRPPYKQIPNFKGADGAVDQLLEMEAFKIAENIVVDMDRVLRDVRLKALEANKTLFVTTSKLPSAIVCKINPPPNASKYALIQCSNLFLKDFRSVVSADDDFHFDMMVVSSVAVSRSGLRVGRDDDLADLEFAVLALMGFVTEDTVVITIVHDNQIDDNIKASELGLHDLPVDYVVTPTQVLKCNKQPKPTSLVWSLLSMTNLDGLSILKNLRYREWKKEKDVRLFGETENPVDLKEEFIQTKLKRSRSKTGKYGEKFIENGDEKAASTSQKASKSNGEVEIDKSEGRSSSKKSSKGKENGDHLPIDRKRDINAGVPFRRRRRPYMVQRYGRQQRSYNDGHLPAIYIGGLPKQMRPRELTDLLEDQNVMPLRIIKQAFAAYGFLLFETMDNLLDAIKSVEGMKIEGRPIKVELARRTQDRKNASARGDGRANGNGKVNGDVEAGNSLPAETGGESQSKPPADIPAAAAVEE